MAKLDWYSINPQVPLMQALPAVLILFHIEDAALLIKNMNSSPTPNLQGRNIFKSSPKYPCELGVTGAEDLEGFGCVIGKLNYLLLITYYLLIARSVITRLQPNMQPI